MVHKLKVVRVAAFVHHTFKAGKVCALDYGTVLSFHVL